MIDFSIHSGACREFVHGLYAGRTDYDPEIIKNYPYFNYLLRSGTPNNFRHGKLGILLALFMGMMKKLDRTLVPYFDAFLYGLLKEMDYTSSGITIPGTETNELKKFIEILGDLAGNEDLVVLSRNLGISLGNRNNPDLNELLAGIDMHLCHVIQRYNMERLILSSTILTGINLYEINKILVVRYFPRTLLLMKDPDVIPSDFLLDNPVKMMGYCRSFQEVKQDEQFQRILYLELKIFEIKFFVKKTQIEDCDDDILREKLEDPECPLPLFVNDTISVLNDYYLRDIDLEYWTGSSKGCADEKIDILAYYDYMNRRVRHIKYSAEIRNMLDYFRNKRKTKQEYLDAQGHDLYAESLLNEMLFKNILI